MTSYTLLTKWNVEVVVSAIRSSGLSATYGEGNNEDKENNEPDYLPEGQRGGVRKGWGWGSIVSMGSKKQETAPVRYSLFSLLFF